MLFEHLGSLESEPANLDEKPKRKRKRRKSILEKDETMPPLRSNLRSDIEKSHFISAGRNHCMLA